MTDPIAFTQDLLARRKSSLLNDATTPAQRSDLVKVLEALCFAMSVLRYSPDRALDHLKDMQSKTNHSDSKRDLQRIIDLFDSGFRPRSNSIQRAKIHRTKDSTFNVIEELLGKCINESNILIVFDWDETLMSSFDNCWMQLESMVDGMDDKLRSQLKDTMNRTIETSNLVNRSGIISPSNIEYLRHLNDLPNVAVKIISKRNAEGVDEINKILRGMSIPDIEVIGTIGVDGSNIEKSVIISNLARDLKVNKIHFVDDSEPHLRALEELYSNIETEVENIYMYEVDLKAQILTPAVSHLMRVFS